MTQLNLAMEKFKEPCNLKEIDSKEQAAIYGGIDPFTVGVVIGAAIGIWRWLKRRK